MEVLTCDYTLGNCIDALKREVPTHSLLLWVWHADKIPPHIGVSFNNHYFSLKANGKDEHLPIVNVQSIINRKKIKTLCFELDLPCNNTTLAKSFAEYEQTIPFQITCLEPIKELLGIPFAEKLTELLDALYAKDAVKNVYGFHIDEHFTGIPHYSQEDIHNRLQKLQ